MAAVGKKTCQLWLEIHPGSFGGFDSKTPWSECVHGYILIHTYIWYIYICVHLNINMHIYIYMDVCMYGHIYIQYVYIYIYAHIKM